MPVFQETENFTLQHKGEDCQESKNESKEDKTTKDKVNNNIQTAEEEIVIQGNRPDLSENLNLESNSSLLPTNEEQSQGNQTLPYILYKPQNIFIFEFMSFQTRDYWYRLFEGEMQLASNETRACEHPVLLKYFKMEKVGVPSQAIKGKMQVEAIDPNLLDDPNKMIRKDIFDLAKESEMEEAE